VSNWKSVWECRCGTHVEIQRATFAVRVYYTRQMAGRMA